MKNLYTLGFLLILSLRGVYAQSTPGVEWEQCIPNATVNGAVAISDTVFTIVFDLFSCTDSTAIGLKSYDADGNLLWEKIYSPPSFSSYHSFSITKDDATGYFITGSVIHHDSTFNWFLKTDLTGNIVLNKTLFFDTAFAPHFSKIIRDNVSGFLFAGETYNSQLRDLDLIRFNDGGDIVSEKTFGGSLFENFGDIISTNDGGYLIAASTTSNDIDVTGNHGAKDIWLVKINEGSSVQWAKCYGDTMNEDVHSVVQLPNGFLVAGMSQSNLGMVSGHHGLTDFYDYWIFRIDFEGDLLWNRSLGGTNGDFVSQMALSDDTTVIITGSSYSLNGNVADHHFNSIYDDQWTMKMNIDSTLVWTKSTGGRFDDWGHCLAVLDSSQIIVAGGSLSSDGDHHSACFSNDCNVISGGWIVKLNEQCSSFAKSQFSFVQEGKEVACDNQSYNASDYLWDFGDGYTSTESNPIHTYSYNGIYTICLTASFDSCSENISCMTVSTCTDAVVADFSPTYQGGLLVQFTDESENAAQWFWDFGDGATAVEQNPSHLYSANGSYDVRLLVIDSCNNKDTVVKTINTCNGFIADFSFSAQFNEVSFTDLTQGFPESWSWFFGDGSSSTDQNPIHVYSGAGTYPVCLISSNNTCPDTTSCKLITVECPAFDAAFSSTTNFTLAQFNDESNMATGWIWDFGDGSISNEQNPSHTYASSGSYQVCLIATDNCSTDTVCNPVEIICPAFVAGFSFTQAADTASFLDQSENSIQWQWNFGDGFTSTEQNPTHIYPDSSGTYISCLAAYDGCSYDTTCDTVNIYPVMLGQTSSKVFQWSIHPNPAHDWSTIELHLSQMEKINLILHDVSGKTMDEIANETLSPGTHLIPWNTSDLIPGVYWLEVRGQKSFCIKKVIIQ